MKTTTSGRHPTTAEWLAKRNGVIAVAHFRGLLWQQTWGDREHWLSPMTEVCSLVNATNATHLLVKINDDAQTIRVLVEGDDALVVVHTHDCAYHKSMKRGMQVALRGLKRERFEAERHPTVIRSGTVVMADGKVVEVRDGQVINATEVMGGFA